MPASTLGLAAASMIQWTEENASTSLTQRTSAWRTLMPRLRKRSTLSELPGRLKLSKPVISQPESLSSNASASVLPTNPQTPEIRTFMGRSFTARLHSRGRGKIWREFVRFEGLNIHLNQADETAAVVR